ncbi:hypothetical protein [Brenneria alni]|nr:hypothetical protein [Brenneria alni]
MLERQADLGIMRNNPSPDTLEYQLLAHAARCGSKSGWLRSDIGL